MKLIYNKSRFELQCNYDQRHIAKNAGYLWDNRYKTWWSDNPKTIKCLRQYWDIDIEQHLNALIDKTEQQIKLSYANSSNINIPSPNGLNYLGYQKAGIEYASSRDNCLMAEEMGLGKTIQAIGLINFLHLKRILIICPASLKINWSRELDKWLTPQAPNYIADKQYNNVGITIINYESIKKFKTEIHRQEWDLLICDESHYLKNPKSLRTKLVFGGGDYLPIPAKRKLFLTGTPILNRPIELFPLLKACGIVTDWRHFVTRYCGGKINFRGFWETSGATNSAELGELLRNKIMIRRLKKDVLSELPTKIRQVVTLEKTGKISKLIALENKALNNYNKKTKDIKAKISELKKQGLMGVKYKNQVLALRECFTDFQKIAKMRLNTAMLKTDQIAAQTIDTVEQCGSAVVFAHHYAVINDILDKLWVKKIKAAAFTGEMTLEQRQKVVDDFQNGAIDVFVGSIKAAGVGITLTRSSNVIFAELDWTPSSIAQAEDRCHRIGQNDSVLSRFMVFDESIDAMLAHKIIEKEEVIEGILI